MTSSHQWYRTYISQNPGWYLASKRGGFLSFGRLVGDHRALWIETNENILLGFRQHDIIPPMIQNLYLADPRMINKFNDTLHTSLVKNDIYQGIDYIYNRAIYPLLTHLAWAFERLDELITHLMTCSSPRRPLLLHALSFGCTSKLWITFLNQFLVFFIFKNCTTQFSHWIV